MENSTSAGDFQPPSDDELGAYLSGDLDPRRADEIDHLAAMDEELGAKLRVMRHIVKSFILRDVEPLAAAADASAIPLERFLPDEQVIAGATMHLCEGAVSLPEALAYAIYTAELVDIDEAMVGKEEESLNPLALKAVMEANIFPTEEEAGSAVIKVMREIAARLRGTKGSGNQDAQS